MPGGFGRGKCRFCDKQVTSCGFGEWKHMQMHYRQVYGAKPPAYLGVNDLVGRVLEWKRRVIANAQGGMP